MRVCDYNILRMDFGPLKPTRNPIDDSFIDDGNWLHRAASYKQPSSPICRDMSYLYGRIPSDCPATDVDGGEHCGLHKPVGISTKFLIFSHTFLINLIIGYGSATTLALINIVGQAFAIAGNHGYRDPPLYHKGHSAALGGIFMTFLAALAIYAYLVWGNRVKRRNQHTKKATSDRLISYDIIGDRHPGELNERPLLRGLLQFLTSSRFPLYLVILLAGTLVV